MLQAITGKDAQDIETLLSSPKALIAVKGLNQSYIENCLPSRLSMLWSTIEQVFSSSPQHLLTDNEITDLLSSANKIESLIKDSQRLSDLRQAVRDPNRLPRKSRNRRIAETIAPVMNISIEEAYSEIRKASKMRGENVHRFSSDWEGINEAETFLQKALIAYIAQTMRVEKQQ